jgi:NADH:ubiquinone oxidoreductase subunit 3 (subunit A)
MPTLLAYVLLFTAIGAFFIFIHLVIGRFVRPYRPDAEKLTVYECGEPTIGSAWVQFDLRFYVVALLFVIFDVEMAFFFPWAVVFGKANALASSSLAPERRLEEMSQLDPQDRAILTDERLYQADRERKQKFYDELLAEMEEQNRDPVAARAKIKKEKDEIEAKQRILVPGSPEREKLEQQLASLDVQENRIPNLPSRIATLKARGVEPPQRDAMINSSMGMSRGFAWVAFGDILVFFAVLLVGFAYLWRRGDLNWVRSTAAQREEEKELQDEHELATSAV